MGIGPAGKELNRSRQEEGVSYQVLLKEALRTASKGQASMLLQRKKKKKILEGYAMVNGKWMGEKKV